MSENVLPFPEPEKEPHPEKVPPPSLFQMWPAGMVGDLVESFGDITIGEAFEQIKGTPIKDLLEDIFGPEQAS